MNTDEIFKLSEDWGDISYGSNIVVMGTGRIGRRVLPILTEEFHIPFLIDNNCKEKELFSIEVVGIIDGVFRVRKDSLKIVVTTMRGAYAEIAS